MGTSNWQNIPFCVEALMKIAPRYVLDIGVGYGRWGMITREFCDVWYGRVTQKEWAVYVAGIEGYKDNIARYHADFYNDIHIGDARKLIYTLEKPWNVIIFGDVLEHFERQTAEEILTWSLEHSDYALINIPLGAEWPQTDLYSNPYEKHLSAWNEADFERFGLVRKALFADYLSRPFGSFILSRNDPQGLRESLFSIYTKSLDAALPGQAEIPGSSALFAQALQLRNEQLSAELTRIKSSRGYALTEKLKTSALAGLFIRLAQALLPHHPTAAAAPAGGSGGRVDSAGAHSERAGTARPADAGGTRLSEADERWAARMRQNPRPVSVNNPEWRGILASANELFEDVYAIPDDLDDNKAAYYAALFREANPPSITIQGFPLSYWRLVKAIRKTSPALPIYAIWHGNLLHSKEDYAWKSFQLLEQLAGEGDIARVGFVKKGMAEVMAASGMRASFIMNLVRRIPAAPSPVSGADPMIGIWGEPDWGWKKLPYAMLASLSLIPNAAGYVVNVSPRAKDLARMLNIQAEFHIDPLGREAALQKLAEMRLNMNVSLTECAPMLPLESLSVGAPCLLGPTSHYFLDNEYLHSRLVVAYPDNPEAIAQAARRALDERERIIAEYRQYAPQYNQRALQTLSDFLERPIRVS